MALLKSLAIMQENWKPDFTTLLLNELSRRTGQALKIASATFSEEIENKKDALSESEFLLFVESEPPKIKQSQSWIWFYLLISKYRTIKNLEKVLIGEKTASLSEPPKEISDLVARIERNQEHKLFLEGMKLQSKLKLLRSANPSKLLRKYDPFAECLTHAIEHEKLHLGNTPATIEFAERIAGMLEAQVNWRFNEFFDEVDMRFERLNRENERLLFLEEQRKTLQNNEAIAFFDKKLYHTDNALETRERVKIAIQVEIEPTVELLGIWQNSHSKPEGLIQSIPFLTQMIDGWVEAKKFEFIEQELELRKKALGEADNLTSQPAKVKVSAKKALPPFEDAVKEPEKLPDLWERLSEMESAFVNESGGFIGRKEGRNVVKVLALSQAISGIMKPGYSQFDTYLMLCTLWDLLPSNRPEKALNQTAYLPMLTDIKDALA